MFKRIVLIAMCIATAFADCDNGWTRYYDSCYIFSLFVGSWSEAEFFCTSINGNLAQLETEAEFNFIQHKMQELHQHDKNTTIIGYWIGAHDVLVEGEFMWMPSGTIVTYFKWKQGQPDNAHPQNEDEDCIEMFGPFGFKWNDRNCSFRNLFVCEAPYVCFSLNTNKNTPFKANIQWGKLA